MPATAQSWPSFCGTGSCFFLARSAACFSRSVAMALRGHSQVVLGPSCAAGGAWGVRAPLAMTPGLMVSAAWAPEASAAIRARAAASRKAEGCLPRGWSSVPET